MPQTIPQITINIYVGWLPFPVMGGLWHCFTHIVVDVSAYIYCEWLYIVDWYG